MINNQKIAITGVSSFVGANLAIKYSKKDFEVIGIISKDLDTYSGLRKKRIESCKKNGVKFYQLDLRDKDAIRCFFKENKVDYFLHHAAWVENANSLNFDLKEALTVNITPLRTIYEELSICSAKGIIITGTNAEYGDKKKSCNEFDICMPTTPYGLSKLCMTLTSYQLFQEFKVPTRVARIFNPLGALDNPNKLLPSVINHLNLNKKFDLSSCIQKRDFIYIGDLVNGYLNLNNDLSRKGFDIFNLCSGEAISVKELLENIAKTMDKDSSLLNFGALNMRPGEPLINYGNNQKANKILGWYPTSIKNKIENITSEMLEKS